MTITYNGHADSGQTSTIEKDSKIVRTITFTAVASNAVETETRVANAGPYAIGDSYSYSGTSDSAAKCTKISAKQETENPRVWRVTYEFANDAGATPSGNQGGTINRGIVYWDADVQWSSEHRDREVSRAFRLDEEWQRIGDEREAIVNSSGRPYDRGLVVPKYYSVLTFTVKQSRYSRLDGQMLVGTVNADVVWGRFWRGSVLCRSISAKKVWERSQFAPNGYWSVTGVLAIDTRYGWAEERLDCGRTYLENRSGTYVRITYTDANGIPMSEPVPLDGNGGKLSDERIKEGKLVYRTYEVYPPVAYMEYLPPEIVIFPDGN